jgi:glycosyltransferase involved in cell wall biosynthesis
MLLRALRSVLAQRDADFEIIVADDGDGDGAASARRMVRTRPLTAFTTGGLGQVPARNMALEKARGRWIAYLDDDDWWDSEDHLQALGAALAQGPGLAYASGRIVREGPGVRVDEGIAFAAHIDAQSIRHDNTLLIPGIAYDRHLHDRLGPFDQTLPVYWDWDWYLRLAGAGVTFFKTAETGVRVSARIDNVTAPTHEARRSGELARLAAKHGLSGLILKNHEIIAIEQATL